MSLQNSITSVASSSVPQPDKFTALQSLLAPLSSPTDLQAYVTTVLAHAPSLGLVVSRPVIASYISHIVDIQCSQADKEELLSHALTVLQPTLVSYEEQDSLVREHLASLYEAQARPIEAATILRGIKLESGQRVISDDYRVDISVRILRNLLEDVDTDAIESDEGDAMPAAERILLAEDLINKTAALILKSSNPTAKLHFKLAQARVFDARKRFLEACAKYYELSHQGSEGGAGIDAEDRLTCLSAAVSCALLAPAGPARGRMLASLAKDERIKDLEGGLPLEHAMLDKLFFDNLLPAEDVKAYIVGSRRKVPRAHLISRGALLGKGDYEQDSVLDRAVTEHNLLAASKLYMNISFSDLAELLGLGSADAAEGYAAKMIQERRLRAVIDRVDGIIYFQGGGRGGLDEAEREKLKSWDAEILGVCLQVEDVVSLIQKQYPEFVVGV
ncbi:hypothetical protein POJ06DRAFT_256388 [Lipomyces tetrasporus]|uniref:COP9 signalosome complex subunit 4 n=1 Tax=Lipomyces tetrasporus TaxID=54092 RepID=A0AAD7VRI5_9ASCO|nr:uncharacterized protein POJ06DRAFT_256388 [Lipomyces tetrasporus]KAJ8099233.1 hypothetical protein POJ06DRAFT_256388 [Lipomyces tetrasporus]